MTRPLSAVIVEPLSTARTERAGNGRNERDDVAACARSALRERLHQTARLERMGARWPVRARADGASAVQQTAAAAAGAVQILKVDGDILNEFVDFFHSTALSKSQTLLNMAEMTWTGVKHFFEALFQSELVVDVNWKDADVLLSRHFRCDLRRFAMDAQSVLDCADCVQHVLHVLSKIGARHGARKDWRRRRR